MILSIVAFKFSQPAQELLVFALVGGMALLGVVLLYGEIRNAARKRKRKREVLGFPDEKPPVRKAG